MFKRMRLRRYFSQHNFRANELVLENPDRYLLSEFTKKHRIKIRDHTNESKNEVQSYKTHFRQSPFGSIEIFEHNGSQITLIGTQFHELPKTNIWKLLRMSQPGQIFVQVRPEHVLKNFRIQIYNRETELYDEEEYLKQIVREGYEVMPSDKLREESKSQLERGGIWLGENPRSTTKKEFVPLQFSEAIGLESQALASLYAEQNGIKIVLADWPEFCFRSQIANQFTLVQLQNIFDMSSREVPLNPDIQPQTPLAMAKRLFPDDFLLKQDKYFATLIHIFTKQKKGKIVGLVGMGESQMIREILESKTFDDNIPDSLTFKGVKNSVVRDLTSEELIEKHALLDVMNWGKDLFEDLDNKDFSTSQKMISIYADPEKVDATREEKMKMFHYRKLVHYQAICDKNHKQGQKNLRKEFIRKVYN